MPRLSILIVDDSPGARRLARTIAEWGRADCEEAEDGLAALSYAGKRFDLILSDIDMPNMDGLGLLTEVEAGAFGTPRPKFVFVSAHIGDSSFAARPELTRADGLLAKPYHPVDLARLIQSLFPGFLTG